MKRRKRERLNERREEKRKEWERVRELQEMEKTYNLLDCHFDLRKYSVMTDDGFIEIDLKTVIDNLSCGDCCHFQNECEGKGLKGGFVMKCLKEKRHKSCELGMACGDDWNDLEEDR